MRVSVIIPTLNAGRWLKRQLDALVNQTVAAEIIVVDSGSTDDTVSIAKGYDGRVRLVEIPRESFDHGGTRNAALKLCGGEFAVMLTQDALPTDDQCLEALLGAFDDPRVAAAFGRQVAWPDAPEYERLTRAFNYPEAGRTWTEADIPRYGVKSYFFSNVCAAYRRSALEAVGGFDAPIETNEDMLMAARLLHAGYALGYVPEASVWHAHVRTISQEYARNAAAGRVMERYRARLNGADADREGLRLVSFVSRGLLRRGRLGELLTFWVHAAARYMGFRAGRRAAKRMREHAH